MKGIRRIIGNSLTLEPVIARRFLPKQSYSEHQQGLQAHGCFTFERRWGHIEPNSVIAEPKYTLEKLTAMVRAAKAVHAPLSINLEMYEDGSVSPQSVALLKQLNEALLGR